MAEDISLQHRLIAYTIFAFCINGFGDNDANRKFSCIKSCGGKPGEKFENGVGFAISDFGFAISDLRFRISDLRFWIFKTQALPPYAESSLLKRKMDIKEITL